MSQDLYFNAEAQLRFLQIDEFWYWRFNSGVSVFNSLYACDTKQECLDDFKAVIENGNQILTMLAIVPPVPPK